MCGGAVVRALRPGKTEEAPGERGQKVSQGAVGEGKFYLVRARGPRCQRKAMQGEGGRRQQEGDGTHETPKSTRAREKMTSVWNRDWIRSNLHTECKARLLPLLTFNVNQWRREKCMAKVRLPDKP